MEENRARFSGYSTLLGVVVASWTSTKIKCVKKVEPKAAMTTTAKVNNFQPKKSSLFTLVVS